jgi:hypothetical protein
MSKLDPAKDPPPRSWATVSIKHITGRRLTGGLIVKIRGSVEILFDEAMSPIAFYDADVYFPDTVLSRRAVSLINDFEPHAPHCRISSQDFDYMLASAAIRNLRPLLRRQPPTDSETITPEETTP